ncbi:SubName: Full=Uncharacterized protein {ECO:0000313/EMBL:CCA71703.1} [Serendipita indica DSM 11827]|nr:SubName: Full=Uncharacterized protein {ECO:0000313/EMBL:CCA71703.1} [Serendipita indica DSM 11827]
MSQNALGTIEESGLSDAQATPTTANTSTEDLLSRVTPIHPLEPAPASAEAEDEDDEEPFVYPGASDASIHHEQQQQEVPELPVAVPAPEPPAERDPALLEEIYAAATAGDLHLLQTLFQTAVSSGSGGTEAFALANDATTRTGLTPLHGAASRGHLDIVQWLVECTGAIVSIEDKEGETSLHKAAQNGHLPVVEFLISAGADPNCADHDGWTPAHIACSKGYLDIVRYLCTHGAEDRKSKGGWTLLMNAASKGHLPVVLYLLSKRRVDPLVRNNWGETAFDIAAAVFEVWICEVLQKFEIEKWSNTYPSYNTLAVHTTVPLILYENQRLDTRLKTIAVSGGRPKFSASGLGHRGRRAPFELRMPLGDDPSAPREVAAWRSDVYPPLLEDPFTLPVPKHTREPRNRPEVGERSHFWLSDWTLDLTDPRADANEGWQYARSFDDPDDQWTAEPPQALDRLLSGAGVLSRASSSSSSQPVSIVGGSQAPSPDATTWVRRRRWIRVLRRRLDIPPLPFLQPDGIRYYLSADGTLVPSEEGHVGSFEGEGQELGTFTSSNGQDYVSRARYLAGTQRKGSLSVGLLDNNGAGVNGDISAADLKRAIGRLERATIELRTGSLNDGDADRKTQAEVLLNVYKQVKFHRHADMLFLCFAAEDDLDIGDDNSSDSDESFHYPMASSPTSTARPSSVRSHATSMDNYFGFVPSAASSSSAGPSRRAVDLTPQLSQAPEFRVPTHEAPQKVSTPRWTAPTPQSIQIRWERDDAVQECNNCRRRFTFFLRKHHCRRCGKIFCDSCSSRKALLDPADVVQDPAYRDSFSFSTMTHRVCDSCYEQATANVPARLQNANSGPALERIVVEAASLLSVPRNRQDSMSQISDLADCPVCGTSLAELGGPAIQEAHVKSCLDGPSGGPGGNQAARYLVYKLPAESTLVGV